MRSILRFVLAAALAITTLQATARTPVPIVNHENVAVERPVGKPASAADVKRAIIAASTATARTWTVAETEPGKLLATYSVRSHTIVTEITYSATSFSVVYKDSTNMKFAPGSPGVIHPFYNDWVKDFVGAIRMQLLKA